MIGHSLWYGHTSTSPFGHSPSCLIKLSSYKLWYTLLEIPINKSLNQGRSKISFYAWHLHVPHEDNITLSISNGIKSSIVSVSLNWRSWWLIWGSPIWVKWLIIHWIMNIQFLHEMILINIHGKRVCFSNNRKYLVLSRIFSLYECS
jgi:hypothetical protein